MQEATITFGVEKHDKERRFRGVAYSSGHYIVVKGAHHEGDAFQGTWRKTHESAAKDAKKLARRLIADAILLS